MGMKIFRIASDDRPTPPTHAVVFVNKERGWGITSDGKNGVLLHAVADPEGVVEWFEELEDRAAARLNRHAGAWIDHNAPIAMSSNPSVEVKPYNDRTWAVYLDGVLLCVTLYRRGALSVQRVIEDLGQRLLIREERRSDPVPFQMNTAG